MTGLASLACATLLAAQFHAVVSPQGRSAAAPAEVVQAFQELHPYLDLVRAYRSDPGGQAGYDLLEWPPDRVAAAIRRLTASAVTSRLTMAPESPHDLDVALVEAAVLLHSDVALAATGTSTAEVVTAHLTAAHTLVQWLHGALAGDSSLRGGPPGLDRRLARLDHREWYLAMGRFLPGLMQFDAANTMLKKALERFPADAEVWLSAAVSLEITARQRELDLWATVEPRRQSHRYHEYVRLRAGVDDVRREAIAAYRRALALDAALQEARLRLAKLLVDIGRGDEATPLLAALLEREADPSRLLLARLLLGRLHERAGRGAEAAASYRVALALQPGCRACRIALAHALETAGDAAASRDQVLALATAPAGSERVEDPWALYPYGLREDGERRLDALRRAMRTR